MVIGLCLEYVEELMRTVEEMCRGGEYEDDEVEVMHEEPERDRQPLSSAFERPDKADAVQAHVSRFRDTN